MSSPPGLRSLEWAHYVLDVFEAEVREKGWAKAHVHRSDYERATDEHVLWAIGLAREALGVIYDAQAMREGVERVFRALVDGQPPE